MSPLFSKLTSEDLKELSVSPLFSKLTSEDLKELNVSPLFSKLTNEDLKELNVSPLFSKLASEDPKALTDPFLSRVELNEGSLFAKSSQEKINIDFLVNALNNDFTSLQMPSGQQEDEGEIETLIKGFMDGLNTSETLASSGLKDNKIDPNVFFNQQNDPLQKSLLNLLTPQNNPNETFAVGTLLSDGVGDDEVDKTFANLLGNGDALQYLKQNRDENKIISSKGDSEVLLANTDKKEGSVVTDSSQGGGAYSSGGDAKDAQVRMVKERPAAQSLPSYVTNQVGKNIVRAFSRGDSEIRLQLKPAELGKIFMTIDTHGDTLKVSVVTENPVTKELLAGHVNELKATLVGSGIKIESFDVEMGSDFKQSMADSREQFNSSNSSGSGRNRTRGGSLNNNSINEIESAELADMLKSNDGALHFVA